MRAVILAAGRGLRLQLPEDRQIPKCLLRFDEVTLLERHLRLLRSVGVKEIVLALGFRHELVKAELDRLAWTPRPQVVLNPDFELGSVLTVHTVAEAMTRGGDVLLMDADVLYDQRIAAALVAGASPLNRVLIDRDFEAGDEPVKLCLQAGVPVGGIFPLRQHGGTPLGRDRRGVCREWQSKHAARGSRARSVRRAQPGIPGQRRDRGAVDRNRFLRRCRACCA